MSSSGPSSPTFTRLLRIVACLVLAAGMAGCTAWKKEPATADAILSRQPPPNKLRITLADSSCFEVKHPRIQGDSLVGTAGRLVIVIARGGWRPEEPITKVRWGQSDTTFALSDIRQVELNRVDGGRTAILIVGVGAAVAIVAASAASSMGSTSFGGGDNSGMAGSCPMLYSWDGHGWVLDSGTYGGAFLRPFAYSDIDRLESLSARNGELRLRLDAGDQETDYVDELSVLAVDHDPSYTIAADLDGAIHAIRAPRAPITARDNRGRDALRLVMSPDGRFWESALVEGDTARVEDLRDELVLAFRRPGQDPKVHLVLRAQKTVWAAHLMRLFVQSLGAGASDWYARMESDPAAVSRFRSRLESEIDLGISIWQGGRWVRQTSVWGGAPEAAKDYVIPLDLSKIEGDEIRVRIESTPSFWLIDWAALDGAAEAPVTVRELEMESAIDLKGRDRRAELLERDGNDLAIESGESVHATFASPPPPLPGMTRSYLSRVGGWYRFHGPGSGAADTTFTRLVLHQAGGIAKCAVLERNRALRAFSGLD